MAFAVALALLLAFVANVVVGASTGSPFVGNVGEMLILFAASIAFVAGILKREVDAKDDTDA
jgi:hypothetical protein